MVVVAWHTHVSLFPLPYVDPNGVNDHAMCGSGDKASMIAKSLCSHGPSSRLPVNSRQFHHPIQSRFSSRLITNK